MSGPSIAAPEPVKADPAARDPSSRGDLPFFLILFLATRTILALSLGTETSDIVHYASYAERISRGELPYRHFPFEYPPWSLVVIVAPALLASSFPGYVLLYRLEMAVLELGTVVLVDRLGRRLLGLDVIGRRALLAVYFLLSSANAPYLLDRLDVPVALLILLSLDLLATNPTLSSVALALGASVKIVPLLALPPLAIQRWWRERAPGSAARWVLSVGLFALLLDLPFLALVGPSVLGFLSYHSERGIQLESVYASLLLLGRGLDPALAVEHRYGSFNVVTGWTDAIKAFSTFATVFTEAALLLIVLGAARRAPDAVPAKQGRTTVLAVLASLLTFLTFSKVLSPQFFIWVYPVAVLVLFSRGLPGITELALWGFLAVATPLIYPVFYEQLVGLGIGARLLLFARNGTLVALTALCWWRLVRLSRGLPETERDPAAA